MKYVIGSLIISLGIMFILMLMLITLNVQAPEGVLVYVALVWLGVAGMVYPFARKMIR